MSRRGWMYVPICSVLTFIPRRVRIFTVVPINYLLRRAPFRGALPRIGSALPEPSETEVVKALRMHASHLEVRMRLPSSSSVWYGAGKTSRKKDVGGYEARREDWASLRDRPSHGWTRARWNDMTTYMVRLVRVLYRPHPDSLLTLTSVSVFQLGRHTTAVPHHRRHRVLRRNASLTSDRFETTPLRPKRLSPSSLP